VGEDLPCNATDHQLFAASTTLTIGNGENIAFWSSAWLQGMSQKDVAPSIYKISKRKNHSLSEALAGNAWIRDLLSQLATSLSLYSSGRPYIK